MAWGRGTIGSSLWLMFFGALIATIIALKIEVAWYQAFTGYNRPECSSIIRGLCQI